MLYRIAVPVFPATRYPGIAAVGAVPSFETTLSIIALRFIAVCALSTCTDSFALAGVYFPLSSTTPAKIEGLTLTPSFAMVAKTDVACMAVTE